MTSTFDRIRPIDQAFIEAGLTDEQISSSWHYRCDRPDGSASAVRCTVTLYCEECVGVGEGRMQTGMDEAAQFRAYLDALGAALMDYASREDHRVRIDGGVR